jgi:ABC-type phosphate transport system permease subunit
MIIGLLTLITIHGSATFWPDQLVLIHTIDGKKYLGEATREDTYTPDSDAFDAVRADKREQAKATVAANGGKSQRRLLRTENFELTGAHHHWISDFQVASEEHPEWALLIERYDVWGNFYGTPTSFTIDGKVVATGPAETWDKFEEHMPAVRERLEKRIHLERYQSGQMNYRLNEARLAVKQAEITYGKDSSEQKKAEEEYAEVKKWAATEDERIKGEIKAINLENDSYQMKLVTADAVEKTLPLSVIVRAYPANRLTFTGKLGVYFSRWGEFLTERPRAANTEGGVFPAIWGTVSLTLLMCLVVVPFGVLAALYLREYAKSGPIISAVRIAINNLAGVPSIVFGVFGLGFFCYFVGAYIDGGPRRINVDPWPAMQWWLMFAAAAIIGLAAFLCGIGSLRATDSTSRMTLLLSRGSLLLWFLTLVVIFMLLMKVPFFSGLYQAKVQEGTPTFGARGLLWSSLTLALLTLPVVIVATEEALAAVPNSMREGSYACGASKWQTIRRIVLPRAMPGIMTGMILAMARGAGEVAPIMLVGAVKHAPELPVDWTYPYIHLERSFMHLGFHIYDVGLQSPNSEAARSLVYTTTFLLIAIIALLNLMAVWLRSRLRKRFQVSQF